MTVIDKDALKAKYAEERDKRLRPDGNDQYIQLKDQLAHYLDDPYTPVVEREPKTDHVTVAFIGGGFAGLVTRPPRAVRAFQRPAWRNDRRRAPRPSRDWRR